MLVKDLRGIGIYFRSTNMNSRTKRMVEMCKPKAKKFAKDFVDDESFVLVGKENYSSFVNVPTQNFGTEKCLEKVDNSLKMHKRQAKILTFLQCLQIFCLKTISLLM